MAVHEGIMPVRKLDILLHLVLGKRASTASEVKGMRYKEGSYFIRSKESYTRCVPR